MKNSNQNIAGLLGTVAVHLFLAIIFLAFQIMPGRVKMEEPIVIDFTEEEPETMDDKSEEEELAELANFYEWYQQQVLSNQAVNIDKLKEDLSTEEFEEKVKEELSKGRDPIEIPDLIDEMIEMEKEEQKEQNNHQPAGKTTVSYELEGRVGRYLPAPVYRCPGAGAVKISIQVNQKGYVKSASVDQGGSNANNCLYEVAREYALKSRFNVDFDAPLSQEGYILYTFIAQ